MRGTQGCVGGGAQLDVAMETHKGDAIPCDELGASQHALNGIHHPLDHIRSLLQHLLGKYHVLPVNEHARAVTSARHSYAWSTLFCHCLHGNPAKKVNAPMHVGGACVGCVRHTQLRLRKNLLRTRQGRTGCKGKIICSSEVEHARSRRVSRSAEGLVCQ